MPAMNAGLVGLLRDRIVLLEPKLTRRELEPYWHLLCEAEWLIYQQGEVPDFLEKSKEIEKRLKKMLGVKV